MIDPVQFGYHIDIFFFHSFCEIIFKHLHGFFSARKSRKALFTENVGETRRFSGRLDSVRTESMACYRLSFTTTIFHFIQARMGCFFTSDSSPLPRKYIFRKMYLIKASEITSVSERNRKFFPNAKVRNSIFHSHTARKYGNENYIMNERASDIAGDWRPLVLFLLQVIIYHKFPTKSIDVTHTLYLTSVLHLFFRICRNSKHSGDNFEILAWTFVSTCQV